MTKYILPIAVVLLMLAAGLRFHALDSQSFWNDEGNSYGQSLRSPADIAINAAADIHPPGYYWLLAGWRVVTGESEFALRSLSVFASVLSAACAFALARRLFGCTAGLITLAAVAVNTFSITYAQEARMYALLALWGAASTWALVVVVTQHQRTPHGASLQLPSESHHSSKVSPQLLWASIQPRWVIILALTTAAGLYTNYAYVGVLALHAVIGLGYLIFLPVGMPHGASSSESAPDSKSKADAKNGVPTITTGATTTGATNADAKNGVPTITTGATTTGATNADAKNDVPTITTGATTTGATKADAKNGVPTGLTLLIRLTVAYGLAFVLFLPWLPTALTQVTSWGSTGDPIPAADAIPVALGYLITGNTYTVTGISIAAALLLVMGLMPTNGKRRADRRALWALIIPPLWVILTVGGFLALGLFRPANLKFLLPAQIGMALWIGRGGWAMWHLKIKRDSPAAKLAPKFAAMAATAAILLGGWGGLNALYTAPEFQRDDYRGIVQAIIADGGVNPAIILNGGGQQEVFDYNLMRLGVDYTTYPLPVGLTPERDATEHQVMEIIDRHERIYGVFWGMDERDPERIVESALAGHAYQVDDIWFGNVRLARYIAPKDPLPTQPVEVDFPFEGGGITLHSYQVNATDFAPGGVLTLDLSWSTDAPIPFTGVVTVQILAADGTLITQHDSQPVSGMYPTRTWIPGQIYVDRHALLIPHNLPAAQYSLIVALYTPDNGSARLRVNGADALTLTDISVGETLGG